MEMNSSITGYLHHSYAESLAEFGIPCELQRCRGWILKRRIPNTAFMDAIGPYPIFSCEDWSKLHDDLEPMPDGIVSLSCVTDPFAPVDETYLKAIFPDVCRPYKEHFVIDLSRDLSTVISDRHKRNIKKSERFVSVEVVGKPIEYLDDWCNLYSNLVERHNIKGMTAFSRSSFEKQMVVPGLIAFRAFNDNGTMGMLLFYIQDDISYYHLGAYSADGYRSMASFALFSFAIKYFAEAGIKWISLGAGAGVECDGSDGLTNFKKGWATGTRTTYFCGKIFDIEVYKALTTVKGILDTDYFPAYRRTDFTK